jgi:hypothetical protein
MKLFITLIICSLIGFLFGFYFWNNEKQQEARYENRQNVTNAIQASARASSTSAVRNTSEHANIDRTLRLVAEKWKITDVNGDRLNNCIDAAVLFYQYYPDKRKVCIEVNRNPSKDFHHLFNCVLTDGAWKAIEPQAYANNYSNYFMWSVWENLYDNSYNRDVTSEYLRFVKK